ncbi:flagellin N-terminal helical domain-containing protein [Frigidibacter sp. MR17.24]|uniref:flagellin N-terminal helical domain-containing protein n=1 Tax=Frigidibacter sp. MR17.24 TaxID=3127345 RepID=UPI00301316F2
MSSIMTNNSAMNALSTLRNINTNLNTTQSRISTGLQISSGKDNAAYFNISETMKGDSASYTAINDGLTLTKNSVATARLGAESFQELAQQFVERVSFAQGATGGLEDIQTELDSLVKQMTNTIQSSTFNGDDMVNATNAGSVANAAVDASTGVLTSATADAGYTAPADRSVVTGITRTASGITATKMDIGTVDLSAMLADFTAIASSFATNGANTTDNGSGGTVGADYLAGVLSSSESVLSRATEAATSLGVSEKSIENQQEFLTQLSDNIDTGVGAMVDANMEEEAARLQALQVQQQLATQSLSIANQAPQNLLSLFQ